MMLIWDDMFTDYHRKLTCNTLKWFSKIGMKYLKNLMHHRYINVTHVIFGFS